jgi:mono/diheme cytochrome c family protein
MRRSLPIAAGPIALLVLAVACGPPSGATSDAESVRRGRDVYEFETCGNCHGAKGAGTKKAPSLESLHRHWTADELVLYLRNPHGYKKDGRLAAIAEKYHEDMAGLPAASEARLRDLAAFLLSL